MASKMKVITSVYYKIFILLISYFFLIASCGKTKKEYFEDRGRVFHTTYLIKYEYKNSLKGEIEAELAKFDDSLNPFKPTSIISKVNNNEDVLLDPFFINVFNKAQEVSTISDGLFDITVSPLINAWGFGFENMENVTPLVVDSLKQFVGYKKIRMTDKKIIKDNPKIQINMSAIAKGYSSDVIAALLDSYGIDNYMVEIGGEVRAKGVNSVNRCWNIGITQPVDTNIFDYENLQTVVKLCNKSMATSGNYRKYYLKEGKRYAHTIDPRTGYPSSSTILSATVIADDCMSADAYATVFMLADTAQTRIIAKKENLSYMLIMAMDNNSCVIKSADFDNYIFK